MSEKSLQQTHAPRLGCFGCGPANEKGLHLGSFANGDELVAEWQPQPHHEAAEGFMNASIIGTLLDCHANWAGRGSLASTLAAMSCPAPIRRTITSNCCAQSQLISQSN